MVGWSADARVANLQRMVNSNRFLLWGLRLEPERMLGLAPEAQSSDNWAEYRRGTHPDGRIRGRMVARAWEGRPGQPAPMIFLDKEDQRAAYWPLSNPRVNVDHVLESYKERMVERRRGERVVLAVQDTTMLHCNGAASGLASFGGG